MTFTTSALIGLGVCLLFGLLFGLHRGVKRSVLRIVLLLLCAVGAFFLRDVVINALWQINMNGQTFEQMLASSIPEEMAGVKDKIVPIINILVGLIVYLLLFIVLQFLSWLIVFPICKIFVKKDKSQKVRRLGGMLTGLLAGFLVFYILEMPMLGLTSTLLKLSDIEVNGQKVSDSLPQEVTSQIGLDEIKDDPFMKLYGTIGSFYYDLLTTTKDASGNKVHLDTQIDAIATSAKIANEVAKMSDINFEGELTEENVGEIQTMLRNIEQIKRDASPETLEAINDLIRTLADSVIPAEEKEKLPIDLDNFDLTEIDFANEADLIGDMLALQDETKEPDVDSLIKHLAKSDIILPILTSQNEAIPLEESDKAKVESAIEKLTPADADAETIAKLKTLFAIE